MPLTCRFYEHKFPEVEDVVMVNVRSIAEMGAYVHLLEYNNIEGMILLSELSRRRIRSINKLIRIGRDECVVVIRVDKDKGKHCATLTMSTWQFGLVLINAISLCQAWSIWGWVTAVQEVGTLSGYVAILSGQLSPFTTVGRHIKY